MAITASTRTKQPEIIIDYAIAYADTYDQLAGIVSQQIRKGWQPYNQLATHNDKVIQCMVKYASPSNVTSKKQIKK